MPLVLDGLNGFRLPAEGSLKLYENSGNGENSIALKAPASVAADKTFVLPGADGTNGQYLKTDGSGNLGFASVEVTATSTNTLTNKTISAGVFTDGYTEESVTANTSTAYTIDLANGTVQILTLTGNCTYTFPTPTAGKSFTLIQKQDGTGSRTVTWPATVKWPASTAPTITSTLSKADVFSFLADGTNWIGRVIGQNYL